MFLKQTNQEISRRDQSGGAKNLTKEPDEGTLRDRLYDQIPLGPGVRRLITAPPFLRLERIRQLGFMYCIWPGATHTRYEHSLGCYYLAQRTIQNLFKWYPTLDEQAALTFQLASLLHDIGHYAFAHHLEELGAPLLSHEQVGREIIEQSEIAAFIEREYHLSPGRVADLVDPPKNRELPPDDALLSHLLSGALDIDKLDYLPRDAKVCNVPYGCIDVSQLLAALRIVPQVNSQPRVVLDQEGIGALSAFLHARQAMYLTVYGHPQNRACHAMLRRAVQDALVQKTMKAEQLIRLDDDSMITQLARDDQPCSTQMLAQALMRQQIYGEFLEISPVAHCFPSLAVLIDDVWQRRCIEQKLAATLNSCLEQDIADYEVLLDIPRSKSWEMEGWICYASPPVGFDGMVPWSTVLGLFPEDLRRYEDARRHIRLFVSARVGELLHALPSDLVFAILEEFSTSGG
jgi:HD superfamily phosphohydrolase